MNMKRMRGRNHRGGNGGGGGGGGGGGPQIRQQSGGIPLNRNHVFDSTGPDLRIRGTAQQLFEKYLQLGRDATSSGDRVMAESYFQHAEHYFRILNAIAQAAQQGQPPGQQRPPRTHENNGPEQINPSQFESEGDEPEPGNQAQVMHQPVQQVGQVSPQVQPQIVQPAGLGDQPVADVPPPREAAPVREPREHREPREPREPQAAREPREPREPGAPREPRPPREPRAPRTPVAAVAAEPAAEPAKAREIPIAAAPPEA